MTNGEAIKQLKDNRALCIISETEPFAIAYDKATKALEQESVIDKIRADLYKLYNDRPSDYNHSQRTELFCEVIKILDKYKGESEGYKE